MGWAWELGAHRPSVPVAQRTHLTRLRRHTDATVVTLPFLFEPQLGLEDYRRMGDDVTAQLGS